MNTHGEHVSEKKSIAQKEIDVLQFWQDNNIFEKTLATPAGEISKQNFTFYDGPPFATGVPHHGHILAGTMKDIIPRYKTMKGNYVRRVWGWDCHGLPIENLIEKELGLGHKKDIEEFGLDKFNQACFDSVLRYEKEWKKVVPRVGRFVDMEHAYKTLDANYTESIWWSWKELYDKKLAYEGYKIMHVCPRCETTLAQSEVALGYKDVTDISVTAKFELMDEPGTFLLAWTTTPWTLPGNTALAVNGEATYQKYSIAVHDIKNKAEVGNLPKFYSIIIAKDRATEVLSKAGFDINQTFESEFLGNELVGKSYKPVFSYYQDTELENKQNIYKVWAGDFVTTDSGTGIVHIAPAFGTDDMALSKIYSIPVIKHVSMSGQFTKEVADFPELYIKKAGDTQSADIEIIKHLAHTGKLFSKEKLIHSYPHCWRCDTPLLNYATGSWFVDVPKIKDALVDANKKVHWVPEHMKEGRFGKWLENAHEWAVSRSRYWGAPIPVWKSQDGDVKVIGSFKEMREYMPKAKNVYYGIRHGEAESNVIGTLDCLDNQNNHLTEKGKEQVRTAAQELTGKGITKIITSPFIRAQETAHIIAASLGITIHTDDRLREINVGVWNTKTIKDLYAYNPEFQENLDYAPDGGESHNDARARAFKVLFECEQKYENETILIVTHGGPVGMLVTGSLLLNNTETHDFFKADHHADTVGRCLGNAKPYLIDFKPFPNRDGHLDVHRPFIDDVKLTIEGKIYTRIQDVFDCWYESGSMPYAEIHYPFENKQLFKDRYPADWIGEGLDQTRGWFYSLMVLGVALFGEAPYKNVIVNGMIMAGDGQKMSKSKKNFTDPMELVEKYGADTVRLYMIASPLVEAENTNFIDKSVEEMHRRIFVRLENVLAFYEMFKNENISRGNPFESKNVLDMWMLSRLAQTIRDVEKGLDEYTLDVAARPFDAFVDDLSVWYVRRSRERLKGDTCEEDRVFAMSTFEYVLLEFSKVFAPFAPFVSERVYQLVGGARESVHLEVWPHAEYVQEDVIEHMQTVRNVVSKALDARVKNAIKVRQPLQSLTIGVAIPATYFSLISDEVNVKEILHNMTHGDDVELDFVITPVLKKEGDTRELIRAIQDVRKNAGLTQKDSAVLYYVCNESADVFMQSIRAEIMQACLLDSVIRKDVLETQDINVGEYVFKIHI